MYNKLSYFLTKIPWLLHDTVMHDLRLIHTDLKPENILLVSSDSIKVPDYKVQLFTKH
jgi:serine/threonine protein kinase